MIPRGKAPDSKDKFLLDFVLFCLKLQNNHHRKRVNQFNAYSDR